jgi:hypothetical protein
MSLHSVKPLVTNFDKAHNEGLLPYAIKLSVKSPSVPPLYLLCLRPPIPSLSGIRKVRKFLLNVGINAETQHLMHKVRE